MAINLNFKTPKILANNFAVNMFVFLIQADQLFVK